MLPKRLRRRPSSSERRRCVTTRNDLAARTLLEKPKSAGNEETWNALVAEFFSEEHAVMSAAASVLACATEVEDVSSSHWRPDDEYASEALFHINQLPQLPLYSPRNGGQRFAHL